MAWPTRSSESSQTLGRNRWDRYAGTFEQCLSASKTTVVAILFMKTRKAQTPILSSRKAVWVCTYLCVCVCAYMAWLLLCKLMCASLFITCVWRRCVCVLVCQVYVFSCVCIYFCVSLCLSIWGVCVSMFVDLYLCTLCVPTLYAKPLVWFPTLTSLSVSQFSIILWFQLGWCLG